MRGVNLLVFRGDQRRVRGHRLKAALIEQLRLLRGGNSHERLIGALLRAGELECGLADACAEGVHSAEVLTDRIADALVQGQPQAHEVQSSSSHFVNLQSNIPIQSLLGAARDLPVIDELSIATAEGFAYYALHPLAYADVLKQVCGRGERLLVVGIRSIGTTLSAAMAAAARLRGMTANRFTVRPQGHPYSRTAEFSSRQLDAIQRCVSSGAKFAVVDEGPGLSGSSFLAVAEALEQAGAPREKIVLVSSHAPNVDALCAVDAARRWRRFTCLAVSGEARRPAEAMDFIGGGQWRSCAFASQQELPASWTSFERLKYVSSNADKQDGEPRLYKFAGLGHYGDEVFERELKVAAAGFGLLPRRESDGFVSYPWIVYQKTSGRSLFAIDLSPEALARMAQYCAFRRRSFPVELAELNALRQMAEHNLRELGLELPVELRLEHPVIVDGRMQPHEWLVTKEGRLLKTDSGSHGDDHFLPGPTDIAWDLAGAIVEWRMNAQQAKEFMDLYHCASGDDASARIDGFIKAYAVFRLAYCLMAANAMSGSEEEARLRLAADRYKEMLTRMDPRSLRQHSSQYASNVS